MKIFIYLYLVVIIILNLYKLSNINKLDNNELFYYLTLNILVASSFIFYFNYKCIILSIIFLIFTIITNYIFIIINNKKMHKITSIALFILNIISIIYILL